MKFARLATKLYATPWHIVPEAHRRLQRMFEAHLASGLPDFDGDGDEDGSPYEVRDGVAVVPVNGVIGKRLSRIEMMCGGADVDALVAAVRLAEDDGTVDSILLDINSPGGMVTGTPEASAALRSISKPLYAFSDSQMCSAAYWIGSSAEAILATSSSDIGSIGTYLAMVDSTRAFEMEGLKLELFKAGRLKAIGLDGKPFTDEERAFLQQSVDRANARFTSAVRASRAAAGRAISDETMQGQWFDGDQAEQLGLVDRVVGDMEEAVASIRK